VATWFLSVPHHINTTLWDVIENKTVESLTGSIGSIFASPIHTINRIIMLFTCTQHVIYIYIYFQLFLLTMYPLLFF